MKIRGLDTAALSLAALLCAGPASAEERVVCVPVTTGGPNPVSPGPANSEFWSFSRNAFSAFAAGQPEWNPPVDVIPGWDAAMHRQFGLGIELDGGKLKLARETAKDVINYDWIRAIHEESGKMLATETVPGDPSARMKAALEILKKYRAPGMRDQP